MSVSFPSINRHGGKVSQTLSRLKVITNEDQKSLPKLKLVSMEEKPSHNKNTQGSNCDLNSSGHQQTPSQFIRPLLPPVTVSRQFTCFIDDQIKSRVDLKTFGQSICNQNLLILIIEDTDSAARILIGSLKQALGVEGNRLHKKPGINGSFYRCVSPADVEALMSDENMKDRFAFIILDNDLTHGTQNYGRDHASMISQHFNRPIIFNSADFNRSRPLSEGDEQYSERDPRFGYFDGVFETVEEKGKVLLILENHIHHFYDVVNNCSL